jgi:hypothetical protein
MVAIYDHIRDIVNIGSVRVQTLRRPSIPPHKLEAEKNVGSDYTYNTVLRTYREFESRYQYPTPWENDPCNPNANGGITLSNYELNEESYDLNDYSILTFIKYGGFSPQLEI